MFRIRLSIFFVSAALSVGARGPTQAADPGLQITQLYAFDPATGKQTGVEQCS